MFLLNDVLVLWFTWLLQLSDKTERVFNASSTLTPDSIMSDESQSRDWQLPEPVSRSACTRDDDGPQFISKKTSESDVRQFSTVSSEAGASCEQDSSVKSEYCDVTESTQLHDCCMLSGIDVSSTTSNSNISVQSEDVSTDAELNDAILSVADVDSSADTALKETDTDELNAKCSVTETNTLPPTLSVSIPISTVFEMERNKDADVRASNSVDEHAMTAYSPISDADDDRTSCMTPVSSSRPANNRFAVREFSPISPFTPRPSAPTTPLTAVPLYWSQDSASSSAAAAESSDTGKAQPYHSDLIVSAPVLSQASKFTFMNHLAYSCQSHVSHESSVRPVEVTAANGYCQNVGFEQQFTDVTSRHNYDQPDNQYPSSALRRHWCRTQQPYIRYANPVGGIVSTYSLYSTNSQSQDAGRLVSVDAGKYTVTLPISSVRNSVRSAKSSCQDIRTIQEVSSADHLPSVTSHDSINNCQKVNMLQLHHRNVTGSSSISNSG